MDPMELAQRLTRDALGCVCGAADAMMQAGPMDFGTRLRWINLIRETARQAVLLGGPDKLDGQDIGLAERDSGAHELIGRLWEAK